MRFNFGFAAVLFVAAAAGPAYAADLPAGCGNDAVQYKVKTEKGATVPAVEAGKAQFVFVQTTEGEGGVPLSRFAVDGEWVGAAKGRSYIAVSVAPGAHTVCASRQSSARMEKENGGYGHVDAVAGKTYYFELTIKTIEMGAASQQGGASLPGHYPGSMTAKRHDTVDQAEFKELSAEEGEALSRQLPLAVAARK